MGDGAVLAGDEAVLDVCDVRTFGTLYARLVDRLVKPDTRRQARQARVADPGVRYHPWYPVLTIGGDKAALYTEAVVADIVGKEYHLTDPAWLLRVGVHLELLTCIGIIEAVRPDVGDLLDAGGARGLRDQRRLRRDPRGASTPRAGGRCGKSAASASQASAARASGRCRPST